MSVLLKNLTVIQNGLVDPSQDYCYSSQGLEIFSQCEEKCVDQGTEGLVAIPGLFGIGVNFCAPEREDVYSWKYGEKAMTYGGFSGVSFESKSNPINDLADLHLLKSVYSSEKVLFSACLTQNHQSKGICELGDLSLNGMGIASHLGALPSSFKFLRSAFQYATQFGFQISLSPLDLEFKHHGVTAETAISEMLGMKSVPGQVEEIQVFRILKIVELTGASVHFRNLTQLNSISLINQAKAKGFKVSCDVPLSHLIYDQSELVRFSSQHRVQPPLVSVELKNALIEACLSGQVEFISINHEPVLDQDKMVNFEDANPGMSLLEGSIPLIWTKLAKGNLKIFAKMVSLLQSPYKKNDLTEKPKEILDWSFWKLNDSRIWSIKDIMGRVSNFPDLGTELQGKCIGWGQKGKWIDLE